MRPGVRPVVRPLAAAHSGRRPAGLALVLGALLLAAAVSLEVTDTARHAELLLAGASAALLAIGVLGQTPGQPRLWLRLATVSALALAAAKGAQVGDGWLELALVAPAALLSVTALLYALEATQAARTAEEDRRRGRLEGEERERARWARDLHDDTLQELGVLQVQLKSAQRTKDEAVRERALAEATGLLAGQLATLRHLIAELRPLALDQLGLEPSLAGLVQRTEEAGLRVALDVRLADPSGRLPPAVEVVAYRVVQESLRNAVRHSGADRVQVTVRELPGRLEVEVSDDGRGLPARLPGPAQGHVGLAGLRERVELAGGLLTVANAGQGGVRIGAVLPLPAPPATATERTARPPAVRPAARG